jgi:hypothetical protein
MTTAAHQSGIDEHGLLQEVIGYLNFSSGASDPTFLRNINGLFSAAESQATGDRQPVGVLCDWLRRRMDSLRADSGAFGDLGQAHAVVDLLEQHLLPAYRTFHRDLLWHQSDRQLWQPLFLGRALEALLSQGGPWDETDRIVAGTLATLSDYIGYRPVAVLESNRQMQPYDHEWVRPIPLYIKEVGVAQGQYEELIGRALEILAECDPDIRHQAWFDLELLDELALDPRAYDFDHPASKRPNYHFGQWDLHHVDNRGHYRRFVLQQITLDSLLARVAEEEHAGDRSDTNTLHGELMFEAAAVLAGTILMASGTSGDGPACHGSDTTLSTLLPHIAAYRDRFYEDLLARVVGPHGQRLRAEAERMRQPFGGARQHLNHELARRRATQMQHVHLAQLYARMGYAEAALRQAHAVRIASARMLSQVYCRLTAGHHALDARQLDPVAGCLPEIEDLLERGIECGALVDPWNVLGFGGNFSLFPALENTVHDYRVDDLIELVEQVLDLCARAWTEAAAIDDQAHEAVFSAAMHRLGAWWDKYATATISGVRRLVGKEIEVSTNLVAGALNAWHKAGAEAGNVKFWRMFVDQFDSPKAFQLVVEALLDRGDRVASMALMMQWISQVDRTPLEDGDASFHPLALRWLRAMDEHQRTTGEDQWPQVSRFFAFLESSADEYWQVPEWELAEHAAANHGDGALPSEEYDEVDEYDELYSAAYEDMVYRDSTDDGYDAELIDSQPEGTDVELEEEAQRLGRRLEFLSTVARLWKHAAAAWEPSTAGRQDRRQALVAWHREAVDRYRRLLELVDVAHSYPIRQPTGSHDSMIEFDRRRMIKESLLEQMITTCVQTADAGRMLLAASGQRVTAVPIAQCPLAGRAAIAVLRGILAGNADAVRRRWPALVKWLSGQELLHVPLAKGGRPQRIVAARSCSQLVHDLMVWLPRLGLVRETCQLLDIAQETEIEHPAGPGAVTEYDRLFTCGYQAIVRCLVASAEDWKGYRWSAGISGRSSDAMLIAALQTLTESQLHRWLAHSPTLRLSVVERLASESEWKAFVAFVERYGGDLFTQKFLSIGNLRAVLHQRTGVWLSNLEQDPEAGEFRLVEELGTRISREQAVKWLTVAIEAVVENYREYRDYNTTTTHSDHGELLYNLVDFLRLRAAYDRVAWNLKPVVMAHEILLRHGRPAAAEMWQQALVEQTAEAAEENLTRFEALCEHYGMRLPSIAERLAERFTRPLGMDRVRVLVAPAMAAAGSGDPAPFAALEKEIEALASEPIGAGLDVPDWLDALEEEVSTVRSAQRHREPSDDVLRRVEQVRLTWDEWQEQSVDEGP